MGATETEWACHSWAGSYHYRIQLYSASAKGMAIRTLVPPLCLLAVVMLVNELYSLEVVARGRS